MTLMINAVTRPRQLQWWQWGQIVGFILPIILIYFGVRDALLWALAMHLFTDFTTQSNETAAGKLRGDRRVIAYHAFISGGYTGLIVGGLLGLVLSIALHFLVDVTNKFNIDGPLGPALDQVAHVLTIFVLWWLLYPAGPF